MKDKLKELLSRKFLTINNGAFLVFLITVTAGKLGIDTNLAIAGIGGVVTLCTGYQIANVKAKKIEAGPENGQAS